MAIKESADIAWASERAQASRPLNIFEIVCHVTGSLGRLMRRFTSSFRYLFQTVSHGG